MEQCEMKSMDQQTRRCLANLYVIEQRNKPEEDKIKELVKEDGMSLLIRNRVKAVHTYKLTDCAVLTLSILCDRPGIAVQIINYIQYRCWMCRRKTVDMQVMLEIFPNVFFSVDDLQRMWDKQKFITNNGMSANMLDFPEYMESIKNI